MKHLFDLILKASLVFAFGTSTAAHTDHGSSAEVPACTEQCTNSDYAQSHEILPSGTERIVYESGVVVDRISEDEWIIRDYPNVFETTTDSDSVQPRSWVSIGLAILKYTNYALTLCQAVQYVSGHDICRIVLSYLASPPGNGSFTYELTGNYIPGYIPGCEPAHSLPCNSGYWEYRVVRK